MAVSSRDLGALARCAGTVIIDAPKPAGRDRRSWLFHDPIEVLTATRAEDVTPLLREAEGMLAAGRVLAGYIAYEAAAAFGLAVRREPTGLPLVWLGVYARRAPLQGDWPPLGAEDESPEIADGVFNISREEYVAAVERVREYIAAGDTYQVNLTCKYRLDLPAAADPFAYYCRLRRAHPVPYGAYLNLGEAQILSCSPELFLRRRGDRLTTRPMKGTMRRGLGCAEDERLCRALRASAKDRAENVMIVDLMRNDLGRVCEIGSIRVPRLFDCERYNTVFQMTSTVEGTVRRDCGLVDILAAAFPCGSVTGAPKHRTMQIIAELEKEPRGPYCGAVGWFGPGRDFALNVAIRTIVHRADRCEVGVGSGITWHSDAGAEWEETRVKTRFVHVAAHELSLFETLLCTPNGEYVYLREHLARLARSARYWGFLFPRRKILSALEEAAGHGAESAEGVIVRLTLSRRGEVGVTTRPANPTGQPAHVVLRRERTDHQDRLLYHKTDRRELYDRAYEETCKQGFAEAIFLNDLGHVTEGSFTSLFVEREGRWFTPPVEDGLLPGIWREEFRRRVRAQQSSLTLDDLRRADRTVIGNSVRGAIEVESVWDETGQCLFKTRG